MGGKDIAMKIMKMKSMAANLEPMTWGSLEGYTANCTWVFYEGV